MKKILTIVVAVLMLTAVFAGCADSGKDELKVGMVTDSGTIDDKSFNEGTYDGLVAAAKELELEYRYLKPTGETEADYLQEIGNLYDAGYKFLVTPGFKFETAIFAAQTKYPDAKFVLLDGYPHSGDYVSTVAENTVSIFFAEHESGFIAGVATAVELQEGEIGFIGGMAIPAVQKFNWGFQQGIAYANENYGTSCVMTEANVLYQGTFFEIEAGQQIAATMFDQGVKAIFCAAGGVGVGAINEAKTRVVAGEEVWIVGVDVDQYSQGIYEGDKSVVITSAMKRIGTATYDMIMAENDGEFPGGETLVFDAANNGVGIPAENPNLGTAAVDAADEAFDKVVSGDIVVSADQGELLP